MPMLVCKGKAELPVSNKISKGIVFHASKTHVRFSNNVENIDSDLQPPQFLSYWGHQAPTGHVDYPHKDLSWKHKEPQRAKMGKWLKGTDPLGLTKRAHDKAIALFLDLEDDFVCINRPTSDYYVSKNPCLKRVFKQCKYAMNIVRVGDDSFIRSWILDSGASDDVAPRELCPEGVLKNARALDNELLLTTAGGLITVTHSVHCKISSTGESIDALLLDESPALLSMGLRCLRDGWTLLWLGFSDTPILVSPCWTKFLQCAVKDFIPYVVEGVTNLRDIETLNLDSTGATNRVTPALLQSLRKMAACAASVPDIATSVKSDSCAANGEGPSGSSTLAA